MLPAKTNKRMGASLFTLADAEAVRAKLADAATWSIVNAGSAYVENDSGLDYRPVYYKAMVLDHVLLHVYDHVLLNQQGLYYQYTPLHVGSLEEATLLERTDADVLADAMGKHCWSVLHVHQAQSMAA
jgi:hypothetical protein